MVLDMMDRNKIQKNCRSVRAPEACGLSIGSPSVRNPIICCVFDERVLLEIYSS